MELTPLNELFAAVRESTLEGIQTALNHNSDVNTTADKGKTSLMLAATSEKWSSLECMKLLIQNGADLNKVDDVGRSAMSSIDEGPISLMYEKLKLLLEAGADPNIGSFDSFPMFMEIAFDQGKIDIMRLLLRHGADPNLWGFSARAFHCLIRDGYENIIRSMVINGAIPESTIAIWTSPSCQIIVSPLTSALYYGKIGLARYFIANLILTKHDLCDNTLTHVARAASMRGHDKAGLELRASLHTKPFPLRILSFVVIAGTIVHKAGRSDGLRNITEIPEELKSPRRTLKLCNNRWEDIQLCLNHQSDLRAWPLGNFKIEKCGCADCLGDGIGIIKICKCPCI